MTAVETLDAQVEETEYGFRKRLEFATKVIGQKGPQSVLDVGCGTGALLTVPLALRFPDVRYVGSDTDEESLAYARERYPLDNLTFVALPAVVAGEERFDVVIASEVLEHVEDPPGFLAFLRSRVRDDGRVLLTVPNGFGPFELGTLIEVFLRVSGLYDNLRRVKRRLLGDRSEAIGTSDTLAVSPHVNFFRLAALEELLRDAGMRVVERRSRTVLCGFAVGQLVRGGRLVRMNARAADVLPSALASDWMLVLEPVARPAAPRPYQRSAVARVRRRLNERRWGLR